MPSSAVPPCVAFCSCLICALGPKLFVSTFDRAFLLLRPCTKRFSHAQQKRSRIVWPLTLRDTLMSCSAPSFVLLSGCCSTSRSYRLFLHLHTPGSNATLLAYTHNHPPCFFGGVGHLFIFSCHEHTSPYVANWVVFIAELENHHMYIGANDGVCGKHQRKTCMYTDANTRKYCSCDFCAERS